MQSHFDVPKNIRINSMRCFIMKILNKRKLQRITFNHSSVSYFKDFMNPYKKCTPKLYSYSFLFIDGTLSSENPSHVRKKFLERI